MLTQDQLQTFEERGVLRCEGLLTLEAVARARAAVLGPLSEIGLWKDGAWRLGAEKPVWPERGLSAKDVGNKHKDVEALLEQPRLIAAAAMLLKGKAVDQAIFKRPQVLVTLPNAGGWVVPTGWHVDFPRLASGQSPGVQLFVFLDRVQVSGGGTLAIAGSHRLLNDRRFVRSRDVKRLLGREAFFKELLSEGEGAGEVRTRLLGAVAVVDEVPLEIVELSGAPGDAFFMDLRVLHAAAPNAASYPRMMATHRYLSVAAARELANDLKA